MKILFLHGRESTPETSSTSKSIKDYFSGKYEVLVPDYKPNLQYSTVKQNLLKFYDENIKYNDEVVVIGISLGGYWATELTNMRPVTNIILLNPALWYYGERPDVNADVAGHIIMNMDDDIVNNYITGVEFEGRFLFNTFQTGGHRMSNMDKVLPLIDNTLDHFEHNFI